jgi:hypothetical protein
MTPGAPSQAGRKRDRWEATMKHHVPAAKIRAVPAWRDSDELTDLERLVLEYAER